MNDALKINKIWAYCLFGMVLCMSSCCIIDNYNSDRTEQSYIENGYEEVMEKTHSGYTILWKKAK